MTEGDGKDNKAEGGRNKAGTNTSPENSIFHDYFKLEVALLRLMTRFHDYFMECEGPK